jgi:hypothetical protein
VGEDELQQMIYGSIDTRIYETLKHWSIGMRTRCILTIVFFTSPSFLCFYQSSFFHSFSPAGELKTFLLCESEAAIKSITNGLNSDVIACVVKLMSIDELRAVGGKIFNPIPGTYSLFFFSSSSSSSSSSSFFFFFFFFFFFSFSLVIFGAFVFVLIFLLLNPRHEHWPKGLSLGACAAELTDRQSGGHQMANLQRLLICRGGFDDWEQSRR